MATKRKTKQDRADEQRRAAMLAQTVRELRMHFLTVRADGYNRLIAITDQEWQEAATEDAAEMAANG